MYNNVIKSDFDENAALVNDYNNRNIGQMDGREIDPQIVQLPPELNKTVLVVEQSFLSLYQENMQVKEKVTQLNQNYANKLNEFHNIAEKLNVRDEENNKIIEELRKELVVRKNSNANTIKLAQVRIDEKEKEIHVIKDYKEKVEFVLYEKEKENELLTKQNSYLKERIEQVVREKDVNIKKLNMTLIEKNIEIENLQSRLEGKNISNKRGLEKSENKNIEKQKKVKKDFK